MKIRRRQFVQGIAGTCSLPFTVFDTWSQEGYPNKPIKIVVPYAPGGTTDVVARILGQKLTELWGQSVLIENRPGGGTVIAASAVAKSPADGYTFLLANNTHVINEHLMSKLPFDPIKDFTAVTTMASADYLLLVNPSLPVNNIQEFIALAKSKPGQINFGTHGVAGLTHLAVNMLQAQAGIKLQLVQYKGAGPAMTAMLADEVQVYFDAAATVLQQIQAGKLKPLAVTGKNRVPILPQVPTLRESGMSDFDVTIWYGLLAPAGLPLAVAEKFRAGVVSVLARPDIKTQFAGLGVQPLQVSGPAFDALLKSDSDKYGAIIRAGNIKIE